MMSEYRGDSSCFSSFVSASKSRMRCTTTYGLYLQPGAS